MKLRLATGLTYNVVEWNADAPGDTTYVLVHGFSDLGAGWAEVAPLLGGHAIAPDMRGHGDSDRIGAGGYYHFMDYVADLDDVIAQLARKRVVVVGHSMGGSISTYWAGTRPERLAALVLLEGLGPPDMSGVEGPHRTAAWIDAWKKVKPAWKPMPSLDEAVTRLQRNDPLLTEPVARRLAEAGTNVIAGGFAWKHDPLHLTMGPYAYRVETAKKYWGRITCPVLAVDGAQSTLNLTADERAARRAHFATCTHLVLDGAGHALQRHQPAALATAIRALG